MDLDLTKLSTAAETKVRYIDNCEVTDAGSGTFPREIEIRIPGSDGARMLALNNSIIGLTTSHKVRVSISSVNNIALVEGFAITTSGDQPDNTKVSKVYEPDLTDAVIETDNSKQVGVNNSSPSVTFHVVGPDGAVGTAPTLGAKDVFLIENDDNITLGLISGATSAPAIKFYKDAGGAFEGAIVYDNSADSMDFRTAGNNKRIFIDSGGLIGINGIVAPSTELDIGAGAIEFDEMTEPSAGASNTARLYSKDDGSGNTQLAVRFATGVVKILATESAYRRSKIRLSAMNFYLTEGTPSQGYIGASTQAAAASWRLDDTANETISAGVQYTGSVSGSTITVDVYWAMESATSGNVALQVRGMAAFADGEDFTAAGTNNSKTVAVAGTAKTLTKESYAISASYAPDDIIRISIRRQGASGADTATGDLHIIAATVKFS